ncbi:MAG: flavodoxin family protein [Thermodesulfobacteriota bacterium]
MKILALNGSPREKGNTQVLLEAINRGVVAAGGEMEIIRLSDLDIAPCIACGGCNKEGKCLVRDDMTIVYDKIEESRRIILGSPIYFYGISAQAKACVDRAQALWSLKYILTAEKDRNRDSSYKGYFVSVAASRGEKVFCGAELTARYFFDALDFFYGGAFLVKGADRRGEVGGFPEELERARECGLNIVKGNNIS